MKMTVSLGEREIAWMDPMKMVISLGEMDCVDGSSEDD